MWVSVEVATVMGLAVLIITVGPVVSLVLLVVLKHSGDIFLVCLYLDLRNCARYIQLEDCWIDWCERCTVWFLWFSGYCDFL